jgi:hypothetical protein
MRASSCFLLSLGLLTAAAVTSLGRAAAPTGPAGLPPVPRSRAPLPALPATAPVPAAVPALPGAPLTLLDEVGRPARRVTDAEAAAWRAELRRALPPRRAQLLLWLGEYWLAKRQEPEAAITHFRAALAAAGGPKSAVGGRATYNLAVARFYQGAYREATERFRALTHRGTAAAGYDRRQAALFLRHSAACFGYHEKRRKAGITEPERIDPECGAASLAVCLRSLGLPHDRKSVLRVCRVTGMGSTFRDLMDAAAQLDLAAHPVKADREGWIALPKPAIVHVERDHFVVLLRADERGVTYGCSDCGEWPGGRRDVTWAQWRLMEPGAALAVVRKGGAEDRALTAVLRGKGGPAAATRRPGEAGGIRLAAAAGVRGLALGQTGAAALEARLRGHVTALLVRSWGPVCGSRPESQRCNPMLLECPEEGGGPGGGGPFCGGGRGGGRGGRGGGGAGAGKPQPRGPSAGDPVNLATGEEEYHPEPDLVVYNPKGPAVGWSRMYNSLRAIDAAYQADDFGQGWSHGYNFVVNDPGAGINPQATAGTSVMLTGTGTQGPAMGLTWDIIRNGATVATNTTPNGWTVGGFFSSFTIGVPAGAASGTGYLVRRLSGFGMMQSTNSVALDVRTATEALAGRSVSFAPAGTNNPGTGLAWDVQKGGVTVASSAYPAGWGVSFTPVPTGQIHVLAPILATLGAGYEVRVSYMGNGLSATFTLLAHRYFPQAGTKYAVFPNGSRIAFTAQAVPTAGSPTVTCAAATGVPMFLEWKYSASDPLGYFVLVHSDRSRWGTTGVAKCVAGASGGSVYFLLGQISDRIGNGLDFYYDAPAALYDGGKESAPAKQIFSGFPLLAAIKDKNTSTTLVTFSRATDGTGNLTGVHDL